jgi:hypothetical protein
MAMQGAEPMEAFRADLDRAWRDVRDAVLRLQRAAERAREVLSEAYPQLARDPEAWRALDPLLSLEELSLEAGRVVDEVRRRLGVPAKDEAKGGKGRR